MTDVLRSAEHLRQKMPGLLDISIESK